MNISRLMTELLGAFAAKVQLLDARNVSEIPVKQARDDENWDWAGSVGVYYFRNDSRGVLYVGRALPGTKFGSRIWSHLRAEDAEWKEDIQHASAVLGFIPVKDEHWYMASALELYLIDILEPPHNARRG